MVTSKTKYEASKEEIKELFSFYKMGKTLDISPLGNGEFNAAYKVSCDNGTTYALKIAPPDDSLPTVKNWDMKLLMEKSL